MSDDRFKQARRSLLDRQNQQRQPAPNDTFGDDFEDEATALVDLNSVNQQGPGSGQQQSGQPQQGGHQQQQQQQQQQQGGYQQNQQGGYQQQQHAAPPVGQAPPGADDDKTEMMSLDDFQNQRGGPGDSGVMIGDGGGLGAGNPHTNQPTAPSYDTGDRNTGGGGGGGAASPVVIGDASDFEGSTQFINISEFAQETSGPSFTPDDYEAGYEGSTQFINLAELQAGAAAAGPTIENDATLKQGYQFGPESIQRGDFTLIFAQNAMGRPVILKQIWEGDTTQMPAEVRQRVAALDQIRHPRLVALNGMLASETGAWVELDRPPGFRLSDIVQQNGPQPKDNVMQWMQQVGEVLSTIHSRGFAYANLTTDAVWIQEDGSVVLEPFDVLTFENRGNLGVFGAPELNMPPQQMVLSPATDVYSLACVMAAALTGLPLNLSAVQTLDKSSQAAITAAIQQDPAQRTPTIEEFFKGLGGSKGGLPELDMKIVIAAVALLGVLGVGGAYIFQQQSAADPAPQQPVADGSGSESGEEQPAQKAGGEPAEAKVEPPGDVFRHESITIQTSYVVNPPGENEAEAFGSDDDSADPEALRAEARELVERGEKLIEKQKREKYREALLKMTKAIKASEMTEEDAEFISDLSDEKLVKEMRTTLHERIDDALRSNKLGRVLTVYPKLAAQDHTVKHVQFFTDNKSAGVTKLTREGAPVQKEEE